MSTDPWLSTDPPWPNILTKKKIEFMLALDEGSLVASEAEVQLDRGVEGLLLSLRTKIFTHNLPPKEFVRKQTTWFKRPLTTWQMFKHVHQNKFFMRWLVSRRPIRYYTESRTLRMKVDLYSFYKYPRAPNVPSRFGPAYRDHYIVASHDVRENDPEADNRW